MTSRSVEEAAAGKRRLLPWTIAASVLLHGVAYASLDAAPSSGLAPRRNPVRFEVLAPPQPKELAPPPEPRPAPPKPPPRAPASRPVSKPDVPLPATEPPPAPAPPPPATEGVTLASDGSDNSFSMPLGNGGSLSPAAARPAPPPRHAPQVAPPPVVTEPPVVAPGDLSSRPTPPSLAEALERNYPADARNRGLSGTAKVRARIDPDGVVRRVSLVEESGTGFGAACRRTLTGSRWAAPKDKAGRSVATEIRYTCRFVVAP